MNAGFRRSGQIVYQPACQHCRACVSIRVPVGAFHPNKSQRRCLKQNQDLTVAVGTPAATHEKFALYGRYVEKWHEKPGPHDRGEFEAFLYDSPVDTIEFTYRDAAGRLLAVGICDRSPQSLSSVYFYFDPADAGRSLGTFGVLQEINVAGKCEIPYYYLGYWVDACRAMQYKASFKPSELLGCDGVWRPATRGQ